MKKTCFLDLFQEVKSLFKSGVKQWLDPLNTGIKVNVKGIIINAL